MKTELIEVTNGPMNLGKRRQRAIEPTDAMIDAGVKASRVSRSLDRVDVRKIIRAAMVVQQYEHE